MEKNNQEEGGLKIVPQEQGNEEDAKMSESLTPKEEKSESFHLEIDIEKLDETTWKAKMPDGEKIWEGVNETPMNAIRTMIDNIELDSIKDEKEKARRYMILHFDDAKALVLQIKDILGKAGDDWFTVYQLTVKTGMQKQELVTKLSMLNTFGLLDIDRPIESIGQRWKIVKSRELQVEILNKRIKWYNEELENLNFQMKELLLNEQTITTTTDTVSE